MITAQCVDCMNHYEVDSVTVANLIMMQQLPCWRCRKAPSGGMW